VDAVGEVIRPREALSGTGFGPLENLAPVDEHGGDSPFGTLADKPLRGSKQQRGAKPEKRRGG
jgi:hypothetical protein